tara:strand:- start:122 stop:361 length:240 start_codon:yes stop_codon:yes gene_type:complete
MTIKVNKFGDDEGEKLIGLEVLHNGNRLVIDKRISITEGKTSEQYVSEAYAAAQSEINAWKADISVIGLNFDENTNTLS